MASTTPIEGVGMKVIANKLKELIEENRQGRYSLTPGFHPTHTDQLKALENAIADFYEWLDESSNDYVPSVQQPLSSLRRMDLKPNK